MASGSAANTAPSLAWQVKLAHDDPETTMRDACRHLGISRSTCYSALKTANCPVGAIG